MQDPARRARGSGRPAAPRATVRPDRLLIGLEHGDDAAVVRISGDRAVVATADFFGPVVDDAYTFGRIAGDQRAVRCVRGRRRAARRAQSARLAARQAAAPNSPGEVLRGGLDAAHAAGCLVAGGHSIDDPEPKYGMAVTGLADPGALLRIDAGRARAAAEPDQTDRLRGAQLTAQGHRGSLRASRRGDDHVECGCEPCGAAPEACAAPPT